MPVDYPRVNYNVYLGEHLIGFSYTAIFIDTGPLLGTTDFCTPIKTYSFPVIGIEPPKTKLWKEVLKVRYLFAKFRLKLWMLKHKFLLGFGLK